MKPAISIEMSALHLLWNLFRDSFQKEAKTKNQRKMKNSIDNILSNSIQKLTIMAMDH